MEFFLFGPLHAQPGKHAEVMQAILRIQGPTRQEPGCLGYGAFRSVRDPDEFYVQSRWRNMPGFEQHVRLPHTVSFVQTVEPLLDHSPKVSLTEQLT